MLHTWAPSEAAGSILPEKDVLVLYCPPMAAAVLTLDTYSTEEKEWGAEDWPRRGQQAETSRLENKPNQMSPSIGVEGVAELS